MSGLNIQPEAVRRASVIKKHRQHPDTRKSVVAVTAKVFKTKIFSEVRNVVRMSCYDSK